MPEIPLSFRLKEAINSVPKFDVSNLSAFVRSCRCAASFVPPALEAELVNMLKSKLHENTYIAVESIHFDSLDSFVDRLKGVFPPTETLNNLRGLLDAITKRRDETMLAYINRIMDIRDGMIDLKRREVGGDLFDAEIEDIDRDTIEGLRDGLPPEVRLRLNLRRNMTV